MTRKLIKAATLLGVFLLATSFAQGGTPPITKVKNVKPNPSVFKKSRWNKPKVIRSEKDAAKYFGDKALAALKKQVNFKKQFVLLFAWRGSGQDKLNYVVAESFPEQIFFSRKAGFTRDLRSHVRIFALRSNVKWRVRGK